MTDRTRTIVPVMTIARREGRVTRVDPSGFGGDVARRKHGAIAGVSLKRSALDAA